MGSELYLLPLAAAICLLSALIQGWILTMDRYLKISSIKKYFPNYRDLVRSHIDFLMMAALIFSLYLVIIALGIVLPAFVLWLILIGALYNPFGFFIQAIFPGIADGGSIVAKIGVVLGFLPLSIGLAWSAIEIIMVVTEKF